MAAGRRAVNQKSVRKRRVISSAQRDDELRNGEALFHALAENVPEVVARFDKNFRYISVNHHIELMTGLGSEKHIGHTNEELGMPAELVMQWTEALRHVFDTGERTEISLAFDGPAGLRELVSLFVPEEGVEKEIVSVLAVIRDITAEKESEARLEDSQRKLRNLAVHLLHAREEERKSVAREIHDELGQILMALKMDLQWIEKRLAVPSRPVEEKMQGTIGLVDQTIQIVHRIATALRPGILDDLGLAASIEWVCANFAKQNGIPCRFDSMANVLRIGGNSATALFRIVQEGLSNIARHAHASNASVEIRESGRKLVLTIHDDGKGVTEEQASSPLSLGLIGIRERVQGMQGEMSVRGKPGEGTTLMVTIPLPAAGAMA
jgi:PAS domain S-box-containing protein